MNIIDAVGFLHGRLVFGRRAHTLANAIAPLLPSGRILDVGCGDGALDALIPADRPDVQIEGVDIMVRPNPHISVKEFDGRTLPYADRSFDGVLLVDVLHHIEDCEPLLAECARVGRKVIIKDHIGNSGWQRWLLKLMDWVGNRPYKVVVPYAYLSVQKWDELWRRIGLTTDWRTDRVNLYPFPVSLILRPGLHFIAVLSPKQGRSQR
ncbi:MAG TPA: class I SAM-dependent methyltransferase [Armatimonadota bacterium]|nr:class I SAM-dependent methyltransferase [Armatimonadota bacterium]